ncbi:hypothetical protein ADK35_21360, partial [Streptomyces viridochromogenes]
MDHAAADQQRAARQPVRQHPAVQQEEDAGEGVGADHQPERADRASGVEHGEGQGDRRHLHPNEDVNLGQSTNDVYPTAVKVATVFAVRGL